MRDEPKWVIVNTNPGGEQQDLMVMREDEYLSILDSVEFIGELSSKTIYQPYMDVLETLKNRDQNSFLPALMEIVNNCEESVFKRKQENRMRVKVDLSTYNKTDLILTVGDMGMGITHNQVPRTLLIGKCSQVHGRTKGHEHGVGQKEAMAKSTGYLLFVTTDEQLEEGYYTLVSAPQSSTVLPITKVNTKDVEWPFDDYRFVIQLQISIETFIKVLSEIGMKDYSPSYSNLNKAFQFLEEMLSFYYGDRFEDGLEIITSYNFEGIQ